MVGRGNLAPIAAGLIIAAVALPFAIEYRYVMDWDSVFRALTGFAGRDIIAGLINGSVRSIADAKDALIMYSDLYGARPGSVVSYPLGQTAILGLMGFISTNQYFFAAVTFVCFLSLMWYVNELMCELGISGAGKWFALLAIGLHPTIFITIWSLRRGLVVALIVSFILLNMFRLLNGGGWREILRTIAGVCAGFLYHETTAVAIIVVAGVVTHTARKRSLGRFDWRDNKRLVLVTGTLVLICTAYSLGQICLAATGRLSMFSKRGYIAELQGSPPKQILTMSGYYTGQYGPEGYLGMPDEELESAGAPEVVRLARGRWQLPLHYKIVYVLSTAFASPLLILCLLPLFFWRRFDAALRLKLLVVGAMSIVYFLFLFPMGGIPDYVPPVLPGLVIWGGVGLSQAIGRLRSRARIAVGWALGAGLAVPALLCVFHFASGRFEECPARYDYDAAAQELIRLYPGEKFGVGTDTIVAKNLAYSLYQRDTERRIAVYTMEALRPDVPGLFTMSSVPRYSYWLEMTRPVPGVRVVLARSETQLGVWEQQMEAMGLQGPMWAASGKEITGRPRRLTPFRTLYMRSVTARLPGRDQD